MEYSELNRAQLSYEYLHTNSTTHEFLFGALAELVDNARDAGASRMDIFTEMNRSLTGSHMLFFKDDGEGMDPTEASNVIRFGCSIKKGLDSRLIGQYGNGLKSGSMRIGKDMIMFTKKGLTMSCLMISRSFHDERKIKEVIVPLPSFHVRNCAPYIDSNSKAKERHDTEMELILKYSPFRTRDQLFAQFKRITSDSGTLVVIYNLKLLDSGEGELDFKTDPHDILLNGVDDNDKCLLPQRRSFRSYVSILYLDPRMKIYIQGHKVQLVKFVHELYKPRCYQYTSARFKTRSKEDVKRADTDAKSAAMRAKEAEGKARELEKQYLADTNNKEGRVKLRLAQKEAETLKEEAHFKTLVAENKRKALKEPKTLNFIFGMNLENRNMDGLFIYNCCRLIKMNVHAGFSYDTGNLHRGVVGLVDIPYIVLEPTHNKQDFADAKEYRHLLRALSEYHAQYWRDLELSNPQQIDTFWESYGYLSQNWNDPPSKDQKYIRKRAMQRNICIQCDACLKWRILPFSSSHIGMKFPEDWKCSLNTDVSHNRCSAAEEKFSISEGKLKKLEKTKAEKQKQLVQEIQKLQGKLEQVKESDDESDEVPEERNRSSKRQSSRKSVPPPPPPLSKASKRPPPKSNKKPKVQVRPARVMSRQRSSSSSKSVIVESDDESASEASYESESDRDFVEEATKANATRKTNNKAKPVEYSRSKEPSKRKIDAKIKDDNEITEKVEAKTAAKAESVEPAAKRSRSSSNVSIEKSVSKEIESEIESVTWPDEEMETEDARANQYAVGTAVEVRVCNKWYQGTIVKLTSNVARIKFEKYPEDKYDKRIPLDSMNLKLPAVPQLSVNSPTLATSSQETSHEMPSSSTSAIGSVEHEHLLDEVARGFRMCLHYFLPPQWKMDKESINSLSVQELASFPLDDFFDNYEKGLRKLVSGFQMDSVLKKRDAERAEASLKNTTRLIVRLLNIIHEEYNLDPEKDRDKLDDVLLACVQQAEEAAKATNQGDKVGSE